VPRLLCGIQEWASKFQDHLGKRYPGDLVRLKRAALKDRLMLLMFAIPGVGVVLFAIAAFLTAKEFFTTDRVTNLRAQLYPNCGDSSDPAILGLLKEQTKGAQQWVTTMPETEASLESIKREVLTLAQMAVRSVR
jgi:hypothetical protein